MEQNNAELIQQVLQGDQEAFGTLVKKYQKGVHALVWRKIGDFHTAQEITQDAFLKAYRKLSTLKNPNQFPGWLYVIAANLCTDWFRKNSPPEQSVEITNANEVAQVSYSRYVAEQQTRDADEARREVVKKLLQKLPESERTVMTLHYLGEMTIKSISEFLGVSENTIKSRLSRARDRLRKEENMIRQNLGSFQLPFQLTENIMQEVSRIIPTAPTGHKPAVPWIVSAASTVVIFLLMGAGTQYLSRFQKPYSLKATAESTVEVIEAFFVLDSPAKPDLRNQAGRSESPGKSPGVGQQPDEPLFAALPVEEAEVSTPKPQWIQTRGPEGGYISTLFVASTGDLYAGTGAVLYRLADDEKAWNLVSPSTSMKTQQLMTERSDTLYIVSNADVLASTDRGETWNALGTRPEGRLIGIAITDEAFYLGLVESVFRSVDAGKSWDPVTGDLTGRKIRALTAIENTVFVGTDAGLYRLDSGGWKQLPVGGETENIRALASAEHRLYVAVGAEFENQIIGEFMSAMTTHKAVWPIYYRSTDLGNTWQTINPVKTSLFAFGKHFDPKTKEHHSIPTAPSRIKMVALKDNLWVLTDGGRSYYSSDAGKTWSTLQSSFSDMNTSPAVILDENTFYRGGSGGIHRTTDAGKTWQQFNTGLVNTAIAHLVVVHDSLYANIGNALFSSADGGESWTSVSGHPGNVLNMIGFNNVLYARGADRRTPCLFRLSVEDKRLTRLPGMPDLEDTQFSEQLDEAINLALLDSIEGGEESFEKGEKLKPEQFDTDKFNEAYSKVMEEIQTKAFQSFIGDFSVGEGTYYMESRQKLFRWKPGTTEWYDTGLADEGEPPTYAFNEFSDFAAVGFKMAVSGRTVYAGKRDGHLFQSFDEGDTWNDVTAELPFSFSKFNVIIFAGSIVYVATDQGVAYSSDGKQWHPVTDIEGTPIIVKQLTADGTTVYGATEKHVYRLKEDSATWKQVTPEVPIPISSLAVDGNTLYVGTLGMGVLRFTLDKI